MTKHVLDVQRVAVWSTTGPDAVAVHRLVRNLRRQGFDASALTPQRSRLNDEVDMIIAVGDPALAVDHAITARKPLLVVGTVERAAEALDARDHLVTHPHLLVRTRADKKRHRVVLASAQITPLDGVGTLIVEHGASASTGLSARLATADPFDLLTDTHDLPDRPLVRIEEATRHWGPPIIVERRSAITVRSARPDVHLRVVTTTAVTPALRRRSK